MRGVFLFQLFILLISFNVQVFVDEILIGVIVPKNLSLEKLVKLQRQVSMVSIWNLFQSSLVLVHEKLSYHESYISYSVAPIG